MRRSGFRKPTFEEAVAKAKSKPRKALARAARPATRSKPRKTKKTTKRTKLPRLGTVRNKCDKLLTPIIQKLYPYSIFSGAPTEVAHHHVKKSKSAALRYYLPNLIPLTHAEHQALHNSETYYASKIVALRGLEWWQDIERVKNTTLKIDVHYYLAELARLEKILAELSTSGN